MTPHVRVYRPNPASGRPVSLRDVKNHSEYESLLLSGAVLYEYLHGTFWVTDLNVQEPTAVELLNLDNLPLWGWYHLSTCDCGACGRGDSQAVR